IITFGTLKARAAIRDVGRVLDVPLPLVDKLCKLIGDGLGTTIDSALAQEPELAKLADQDPQVKQTLNTARRLEGLARHAGVHAAGVVVATEPLDNINPHYQPPGTDQLVTQWDGPTVEKVGLLKMDFLGLRTLSIIERCKQLVQESFDETTIRKTVDPHGDKPDDWDPLDLERLRYDDPAVLDLFKRGETAGVFQFESGGMRNLLMMMKPDRLGDLIAANALYRPGPMDLIPEYVDRKHGRKPVPEVHPIVDKFTEETYGIMVYQEQVMQILHELGDIPLREAYTIIKAISKKKEKTINAARDQFLTGAAEKNLDRDTGNELFDLILKFAGYGFNKSHSTGYAIVAWQTAYLKTYFPVQYMAALLTYESVSTDKVVEYTEECRRVLRPGGRRGIDVKPPEINLSGVAFTDVFADDEPRDPDHGHIRFGLSAVKGVGTKAIESIIQERKENGPFTGLYKFCERVPAGAVNRTTIEALIKCGAFDSVHGIENRSALMAALDDAVSAGQRAAADKAAGQATFFGEFEEAAEDANGGEAPEVTLPSVNPWSQNQALTFEKEVLGFYVSSHPLDQHLDALQRFGNTTVADINDLNEGAQVILGGMLTRVRTTFTRKKQEKMAIATLEDKTGSIDTVLFPRTYAMAGPLLEVDRIVFVKAKVDRKREEPNLLVDELIPIERAPEMLTRAVCIQLNANGQSNPYNGQLNRLATLLHQESVSTPAAPGAGKAEVVFIVRQGGHLARLRSESLRIPVTRDLPDRVNTLLEQNGACTLHGPANLKKADGPVGRSDGPTMGFNSSRQGEEVCASVDRY
ncbi:MAG: DNA polymerase III subunit alpha, partial [Phycisphaeraceae bacterium]|nr:DNA polymerase III subunit alpha [Phycisphaeraceae bacterium]